MKEVANVLDVVSLEFGINIKEVGQKSFVSGDRANASYDINKGKINIGLRNRGTKGEWGSTLPDELVYSNLAHEIAHGKYQNHGKEFRELEGLIKKRIETLSSESSTP